MGNSESVPERDIDDQTDVISGSSVEMDVGPVAISMGGEEIANKNINPSFTVSTDNTILTARKDGKGSYGVPIGPIAITVPIGVPGDLSIKDIDISASVPVIPGIVNLKADKVGISVEASNGPFKISTPPLDYKTIIKGLEHIGNGMSPLCHDGLADKIFSDPEWEKLWLNGVIAESVYD